MSLDPLAKRINDGNPSEEKASQEFPTPPSEFFEEDNTRLVLENSTIAMDEGNISDLEQSKETQYTNNSNNLNTLETQYSNNSNNLNTLEQNTYKTNVKNSGNKR